MSAVKVSVNFSRLGNQGATLVALLAVLLCLSACELFELSPYQADVDQERLTHLNLERLRALKLASGDSFKFAVIADSHADYTTLSNWVHRINKRNDITLVLHLGDQTDYGLKKEFMWTRDVLAKLAVPHLTVIGNHDSLSNGPEIYRRLYGEPDYTLDLGGVQFVMLNDNAWEFGGEVPAYDWLAQQLQRGGAALRFVCAHIPPFGVQMDRHDLERYRRLMRSHGVDLSLHGHVHQHYLGERYKDGVHYLVVDDLQDRNFVIVTVGGGTFKVSRVYF